MTVAARRERRFSKENGAETYEVSSLPAAPRRGGASVTGSRAGSPRRQAWASWPRPARWRRREPSRRSRRRGNERRCKPGSRPRRRRDPAGGWRQLAGRAHAAGECERGGGVPGRERAGGRHRHQPRGRNVRARPVRAVSRADGFHADVDGRGRDPHGDDSPQGRPPALRSAENRDSGRDREPDAGEIGGLGKPPHGLVEPRGRGRGDRRVDRLVGGAEPASADREQAPPGPGAGGWLARPARAPKARRSPGLCSSPDAINRPRGSRAYERGGSNRRSGAWVPGRSGRRRAWVRNWRSGRAPGSG